MALQSIREQRYDQIYPTLDPLEIERVRRFGDLHSFAAGESLWTIGQVAPGLMVILTGKVAVTERDQFDNHKPIAVHCPGNLLGELALLSGRPALVDAAAQEPVEALIIPSERLRALMIAEAELGSKGREIGNCLHVPNNDVGHGLALLAGNGEGEQPFFDCSVVPSRCLFAFWFWRSGLLGGVS